MTGIYHPPIKHTQTIIYPGYQFYAHIRMNGMSNLETFHYVILTIYEWINSKIVEMDLKLPELQVPEPKDYGLVNNETFLPVHMDNGIQVDITPLYESGIWSLRHKVHDSSVDGRQVVEGRYYTTRVGVRLIDNDYTELGIRIDVTDPASGVPEPPFCFRPTFVKELANQPNVVFSQACDLKYAIAGRIETNEDYKQLLRLLDDENNQLALVIFTYAYPESKKTEINTSIDELIKWNSTNDLLHSSIIGKSFPGTAPGIDNVLTNTAKKTQQPIMPYNADKFSKSAFSFVLTFVLGDQFTEKFKKRIKKYFEPGDILICGTKKFRGGVNIFRYQGENKQNLKKVYNAALEAAQGYIKHKASYSHGSVMFEDEARKKAQQNELNRILESKQIEDQDKIKHLEHCLNELKMDRDEAHKKNGVLEKQNEDCFTRGAASRDPDFAFLENENSELRKELKDEKLKNIQMSNEYQKMQTIQSALVQIRKVEKMPKNNADIVQFFKKVYPDRLGFTERGESTASRCGLQTSHLWDLLYVITNDLVEQFRINNGSLNKEDVIRITGCEMSFQEGSMTRKQKDMMRLREDIYENKPISVEPHLKIKKVANEPAQQRLHFCFDTESKIIIIGYIGDHLASAGSKYAKKE